MASGTVTLRGVVSGLPVGSISLAPPDIMAAAPIGTRTIVNLASGNNTITLPTGYTSVVIQPPSGNATAILLKGVAGDTGSRLHNTRWQVLHFDSSVTTFVLNAAAIINGVELTVV